MTGGAGYVLSREAVTRFVSGHGDASKCRPGDEGPEDVEMSRCLQRLGVNFLDTRDKYGRNRFFHFSGEDALSLSEQVYRPDLSWILNYGIIPLGVSIHILYNRACIYNVIHFCPILVPLPAPCVIKIIIALPPSAPPP